MLFVQSYIIEEVCIKVIFHQVYFALILVRIVVSTIKMNILSNISLREIHIYEESYAFRTIIHYNETIGKQHCLITHPPIINVHLFSFFYGFPWTIIKHHVSFVPLSFFKPFELWAFFFVFILLIFIFWFVFFFIFIIFIYLYLFFFRKNILVDL